MAARAILMRVFCGALFGGLSVQTAEASRYVELLISVDGKLVLKSSLGDNGHPDADEVWRYLDDLRFAATEHFPAAARADGIKTWTLHSDSPEGRVTVDVWYGGVATVRELKLIRVTPDRYGREWRVAPDELIRTFEDRTITRSQAAGLKSPKLSK
ncbi:MAG TPA: hypothetical protein VM165_04900 [Planctomycetaceae bacterium]|nr:hypothetical protein [Planctomycetaceae bacterium]